METLRKLLVFSTDPQIEQHYYRLPLSVTQYFDTQHLGDHLHIRWIVNWLAPPLQYSHYPIAYMLTQIACVPGL